MNPAEQLLQRYAESARVAKITQLTRPGQEAPRIQLRGLAGSLESFLIAASYRKAGGHYLIVGTDKEEAAYIQNTIAALLPKKQIRLLPDSFRRPLYFEVLDPTNVLMRTETINYLTHSQSKGEIVVTYPEALFEQVVAPDVLTKSRIEIQQGEDIDVDTILEVLVEYGFKREEFVYEPGQFSIRGGIIDIYSYGNEYPYRIELFDDEVESIRTFDPMNQLSVEKVTYVSIVPNINTKFERSQKTSIFNVLPEDTTIWLKDFQLLLDRLGEAYTKATELGKNLTLVDDDELKQLFDDRAFIRPGEVIEDVAGKPIVFFSDYKQPIPIDETIDCRAKPQPSFNKNFELLIRNLLENTSSGLTNYIFTDNPKQIERFYSIFHDLNADVRFEPVPVSVHAGFIDSELESACYTDHQIFERFHRYKLRRGFTRDQALNLRLLRDLTPGDMVVHIDHGVGRFSGLEKLEINDKVQESVRLVYKNNDILYVGINSLHKLSKYSGKDGQLPRLDKIGGDHWKNLKSRTKKKMKDMAGELIKLYAKRQASPGHAFPPDGYLQNELEASFIYEDTPDQLKATNDVKGDMMKPHPMDRLICGDVGFGKTEIALRAAFKAAADNKQVAVLVPTTILALQHFRTFSERLGEFGITVDYINRFRSAKQKTEIFKRLKAGKLDVLIGTHAILSKRAEFKDLGLLIIDEEQKFGVKAKEKLRAIQVNVDTLTLTATPIPRTMQFSLMNARDLSVIRTPPPNRQPIHTEVRQFNEEVIKEAIEQEVSRGGQVFFVHNRVKSLVDMVTMLRKLCPDIQFATAHGQMDPKELEETLIEFIDRRYDVLVCTNIIETGLDIANANTIIINNAHQFGLSDLHQLRGRVGRSNKKAYCYLIAPALSVLTPDARKRLRTLEEFSDLGSGFNIAMKDLDIRGAGNLLGGEQSGFIADIGYETYQRILEEAVRELKQGEFRDVFADSMTEGSDFVREVTIETDTEMHIPTDYVESTQERLRLYQDLDNIEDEDRLQAYANGLKDRFGPLPTQVEELFDGLRLRWLCRELGFDRVVLKNDKLLCFFVEDAQSLYYDSEIFKALSGIIAAEGKLRGLQLKQTPRRLSLIKERVYSLTAAQDILAALAKRVNEVKEERKLEKAL
ncbi:transcription-repair coupling factor (superfamily II helicase) [Lewinella aquimaris]|uniref:Transcription-repair-coupling factor n=1 Tax=Neolewinella aquimaris TaxID=1835722 RepID=A0A840E4Z2_9BACT|nr:transcription-repair coupling factor [Neolewinella aquimaris]MBB4080140.1 transcription-repair coupling factor (superfamily II helicase) [Neolewinella aquimaris]